MRNNPSEPKFMQKLLKYSNKTLKSCDVYGEPVTLNFKGDDKFKTGIGGFWSLLTFILVGLYFILSFYDLVTDRKTTFVSDSDYFDLYENLDEIDIAKQGFEIALGEHSLDGNFYFNNSGYFNVTMETSLVNGYKTGSITTSSEDLGTVSCKGKLDDIPEGTKSYYNIDDYLWVGKQTNLLSGTIGSNETKSFTLNITKWIEATWKTSSEIDAILNNTAAVFGYYKFFFNSKIYDSPINKVFHVGEFWYCF